MLQVQEAQPQSSATRVEVEYRFPLTMSMVTTGYQNGQKLENNVVVFYLNPARQWLAMPRSNDGKTKAGTPCTGLQVFDLRSGTLLVVNTREKRGIVMHLPSLATKQAEERRVRNLPPAGDNGCFCALTGKKKTIEGFSAVEYSCKNPTRDTRFDMWVTRELKIDLAPPGSRLELNGFLQSAGRLGGIPLEGYYFENGEMKSSMQVTDVNRSAQFFVNTEQYKLSQR